MALPKLFNPAKPGPGVSKNGPKKKRFFLFWELYFRKFFKLIQVNLLYILFSLPVLTVGLAEVGTAYITRNFVREKHAFVWSDFIDTIKKNWKQALPIGLINLVVELVFLHNVWFYAGLETEATVAKVAMTAVAMLLLIVFTFMRYYIPLMIVTFKLSWKQLYKNALIFSFVAIFQNLLITLCTVVFYVLLIASVISFGAGAFFPIVFVAIYYLLFFPAFRAFLTQFCIFPKVEKHMIEPYYRDHPDEDHEKKQALNIADEVTEQKAKEEAIFEDRGRTDSYLSEAERADLPPIPKQYSEREMRRFRASQRRARGEQDADDDGTI